MPEPICHAQSGVQPQQLNQVRSEARRAFTEARAISDAEILDPTEWRQRASLLKARLGLDLDGHDLAKRILNWMGTTEMPTYRTYTNTYRLIKSRRIQDNQLLDWLRLTLKEEDKGKFREMSQQIFLGAQLFFYKDIPGQGVAWCYMPKS